MTTKFKLALGIVAALVTAAPLVAQGPSPKKSSDGQWTQLFDGKSLAGWRGYKAQDAKATRWKVEDGTMTVPQTGAGDTKGRNDLITDATYDQFHLRWEWKIAQGGNSGV